MDEAVPDELIEEVLYPLFGGYHGYRAAPAEKIQRHRLRAIARWQAEEERRKNPETHPS